jgi:hypothetical protein
MAAKKNTAAAPTEKVSLRIPRATHRDLQFIAHHLGQDFSGVVNRMIAERLPDYMKEAAEVAKRHEEARRDYAFIIEALPATSIPLVRMAMEAGRLFEDYDRVKVMKDTVEARRRRGDAPTRSIVFVAFKELEKEKAFDQVEQWLNQLEEQGAEGQARRKKS